MPFGAKIIDLCILKMTYIPFFAVNYQVLYTYCTLN